MDNIENKTAIITGGSSGIGYHVTEELLRKGAKKVAILDLPVERCYNATVTLQEEFGKDRVIFFPIDITNSEVYSETFKKVVENLDGLDLLVNNAGVCNDRCIEQTFAVNVIALIRGSLLSLEYMSKYKGGKGGTIINVASVGGLLPFILQPIYSTSKYAVVGFGYNLAKFYEQTGVRIITMCPKHTLTPMLLCGNENRLLDIADKNFIDEKLDKDFYTPQSAMNVAQAIITTIQKGKNGSVWIVQNNEPPFQIKKPTLEVA